MSRDQDFSAGFIFASELRQSENFQVKNIKRTRWPFYPTLLCRLTFKFTQYLSSMSYLIALVGSESLLEVLSLIEFGFV